MCTTCGCAAGETRVDGEEVHEHAHRHEDGTQHIHAHRHAAGHAHLHPPAPLAPLPSGMSYSPVAPGQAHTHRHADGSTHDHAAGPRSLHFGDGPAGAHAPGMSQSRMVQIERDILSKNDGYAAQNRSRFDEQGIFALNLVSSPGSGKTTLLCRTLDALKSRLSMAVIEGDQQTSNDAERIRQTGVPALQINTGKGCHLDAHMVGHALHKLSPADDSLLFIENVGNLVCPAAFDLGEAHKVAILSVTEGEDKPLKYPDMFRAAGLLLINKIDLLPYVSFKLDLAIDYARRVNPALQVVCLSATSGEGFAAWLDWLESGCAAQREKKQVTVAALKRRIAELEAQLATQRSTLPS
jgi:hydrogenase nickel incorporation protein HypB